MTSLSDISILTPRIENGKEAPNGITENNSWLILSICMCVWLNLV